MPSELLEPADPVPHILSGERLLLGDLVLYTGDVLDHDKECREHLNALEQAVKSLQKP